MLHKPHCAGLLRGSQVLAHVAVMLMRIIPCYTRLYVCVYVCVFSVPPLSEYQLLLWWTVWTGATGSRQQVLASCCAKNALLTQSESPTGSWMAFFVLWASWWRWEKLLRRATVVCLNTSTFLCSKCENLEFLMVLYKEREAALVSVPQCVLLNASFFVFCFDFAEKTKHFLHSSDKMLIKKKSIKCSHNWFLSRISSLPSLRTQVTSLK